MKPSKGRKSIQKLGSTSLTNLRSRSANLQPLWQKHKNNYYRSWVVRQGKDIPFIVKFGVSGLFGDTSRLLSKRDVQKSIEVQEKLNKISNPLLVFEENLGLFISGYSGIIIRKIPQQLLGKDCQVLSFSALMSVERSQEENKGLCNLKQGMEHLPLIFEIIDNAIAKGPAENTEDFIRKFLIQEYLKKIEELHFKNKMSFSPYGQNLCLVLDKQGIPCNFAYRDFEGIQNGPEGFLQSFTFFYQYHCFVKLLNVLRIDVNEYIPSPRGRPHYVVNKNLFKKECYTLI